MSKQDIVKSAIATVGIVAVVILVVLAIEPTKTKTNDLASMPAFLVSKSPLPPAHPLDSSATLDLPAISRLQIVSLGVDAPIVTLGVDATGTMQSPNTPTDVAWYDFSSNPLSHGNVVLAGHVDFAGYGPAVFWSLRNVKPGDKISLLMADQSTVSYRIVSLTAYDEDKAPVKEIVGPSNEDKLTLITCQGTFDPKTHSYDERLVVRAIKG